MPILRALANPKPGEREVLTAMLDREPDAVTGRPGLLVIADKGSASEAGTAVDMIWYGTEASVRRAGRGIWVSSVKFGFTVRVRPSLARSRARG